jgi:very-short-patch-repair endonuclease
MLLPPWRGKAGMGGMHRARARQLRRNLTEAEQALWRHLRLRQLDGHKFRRQQPIGPYIADFICFETRLIVELDGGQHSSQTTSDAERSAWLEMQGFRVMRFWNHEVLQNTEAVTERIREACLPPHPNLPPPGGKEGEQGEN